MGSANTKTGWEEVALATILQRLAGKVSSPINGEYNDQGGEGSFRNGILI